MNTTHTPGPWEISRLATPDHSPQFAIYQENYPLSLAIVVHENSEANARLIHAAPDLLDSARQALERLEHIVHMRNGVMGDEYHAIMNLRSAIAKATTPS
jgi:hypothetical protein